MLSVSGSSRSDSQETMAALALDAGHDYPLPKQQTLTSLNPKP